MLPIRQGKELFFITFQQSSIKLNLPGDGHGVITCLTKASLFHHRSNVQY